MVTGPPRSGKTSLLQLLYEAARRSTLFSDIFHVNLADNSGNLKQGLAQYGTTWKDLFAAGSPGKWLLNWDSSCTGTLDSDSSLERLRLSKPQYRELLSNFRILKCADALSDETVRKALYHNTAGKVSP
ncbi:g7124 [Coccomyxa viridis]|uniref:G7124 protein n=1 Tax=Coccomyxa viridis TaxID=1274662 RepID=A0ABP1FX23_9CHLO